MINVLKNISGKKKVHNSIISSENRDVCPIFIEMIACIHTHTQTTTKNALKNYQLTEKLLFSKLLSK